VPFLEPRNLSKFLVSVKEFVKLIIFPGEWVILVRTSTEV
jgi:hypothetical protein